MWRVILGLQPMPSSPSRREPSSRSSVSSRNDSFASADASTTAAFLEAETDTGHLAARVDGRETR
jgi:hypothetical protein